MKFSDIEKALDAGKLEMQRPWGDYVRVRRRGNTGHSGGYRHIEIYMEGQVEARLSSAQEKWGYPGLRIAA